MDTKLTLKLDQEIIERAKQYASKKRVSLSRIVENYLQVLTKESASDEIEISPYVKSLSSGVKIPDNLDYKKEYSDYLAKKHS